MHDWTKEDVSSIMTSVREWFPTIILVCAVYVGVTALFALLLVVGVLVAEPPAGRGRPRDGRLGLGGAAAVLSCIAGVFVGPQGRHSRGGQRVA